MISEQDRFIVDLAVELGMLNSATRDEVVAHLAGSREPPPVVAYLAQNGHLTPQSFQTLKAAWRARSSATNKVDEFLAQWLIERDCIDSATLFDCREAQAQQNCRLGNLILLGGHAALDQVIAGLRAVHDRVAICSSCVLVQEVRSGRTAACSHCGGAWFRDGFIDELRALIPADVGRHTAQALEAATAVDPNDPFSAPVGYSDNHQSEGLLAASSLRMSREDILGKNPVVQQLGLSRDELAIFSEEDFKD